MGFSGGLPATQISFDMKFSDYSDMEKIKSLIESEFDANNIGYFLGCEIGAWEVNWGSGVYTEEEIEHMTQGGIDCFILNPEYSNDYYKLEDFLHDIVSKFGCIILGVDCETVYYEYNYIDYIAKWYRQSREEVVDNLIDAGYIEEDDREYYLDR